MNFQNKVNELRKKDILNFKTNYFMNKINNNALYLENDNAIICLTQDRDIYRLYFAFINLFDFEYGFIELLNTKSGKARKIPLSTKLRNTLSNIQRISDYVFVNPQTFELYVDLKKSFKKVLEKANIKNFRFHDLRHTVATRLVEKGVDLVVVQEILGHSKLTTTQRYAHPVPQRKSEAINILNNYQ